jgi:hypothetical protein
MTNSSSLESLDNERLRFPLQLAEGVWDALSERDPGQRFDRVLGLFEWLIQRLATLALSEYVHHNVDVSSVERSLVEFARPGGKGERLSLGDYRALLQSTLEALRKHGGERHIEQLVDLAERTVEPDIAQRIDFIAKAVEQREYNTPSIDIERMYKDKLTSEKMNLSRVLHVVVRLRNDKAHPKSAADPDWFRILNARLEPVLADLLLWPPINETLTGFEAVRALRQSVRTEHDWATDVVRSMAKQMTPSGSAVVHSDLPLLEGNSYLARRDSDQRPVRVLFGVVDIGSIARSRRDRQRARSVARSFYQVVFDKGCFGSVDRTQYTSSAGRVGFTAAEVDTEIENGWESLKSLLDSESPQGVREEPGGTESASTRRQALLALFGSVPDDILVPRTPDDLRTSVLALRDKIRGHVRQHVERIRISDGLRVLVAEEMEDVLGIPKDLVVQTLKGEEGVQQLEAEGTSEKKGWTFFRIPRIEQIAKYRQLREKAEQGLGEARSQSSDLKKVLDELIVDLLTLSYDLLETEEELSDLDPAKLRVTLTGEARSTQIRIVVCDREFQVTSGKSFSKQIYDFLWQGGGDTPAQALQSLPWTWGRVRRLAALDAGAADGRNAMTSPVGIPESSPKVYFDLNASAEEIAYCVVQHLRKVKVPARIVVERPSQAIEALDVIERELEQPFAVEDAPFQVEFLSSSRFKEGDPRLLTGRTVDGFISNVLRFLVDDALPFENLPVRMGRSRLLLSLRPDHGRSGVPFVRPIHYEGVYAEADLTESEAVPAVINALRSLGAELRVPEDAEEVDAEEGAEDFSTPAQCWYVNAGRYSWLDMRRYGFWQAGGGARYRAAVLRMRPGDRVYLYRSRMGYVGRGIVVERSASRLEDFQPKRGQAIDNFPLTETTRGFLEESRRQTEELAEYVVGIDWSGATDEARARKMSGMFTSPMTACKLTDAATLAFLDREFDGLNEESPRLTVTPSSDWKMPANAILQSMTFREATVEVEYASDVFARAVEFLASAKMLPAAPPLELKLYPDDGGSKRRIRLANGWYFDPAYFNNLLPTLLPKLVQLCGCAADDFKITFLELPADTLQPSSGA